MAAIHGLDAGSQIWAVGDFSAKDLGSVGLKGPAVQALNCCNRFRAARIKCGSIRIFTRGGDGEFCGHAECSEPE